MPIRIVIVVLALLLGMIVGYFGSAPGSTAFGQSLEDVAAGVVPVRVGEHDGYSRIVFDWSVPVAVESETGEGGDFVLRFNRAGLFDLGALDGIARLQDATQVTATPASLSLRLASGVAPRLSQLDSRVIVDLRDAATDTAAVPAPATPAEPAPPAPEPAVTEADAARDTEAAPTVLSLLAQAESDAGIRIDAWRGDPVTGTVRSATDLLALQRRQPVATVTVVPPGPARLAVFRRDGSLWLVSDGDLGNVPPSVTGPAASRFLPAQRVETRSGSAYRLRSADDVTLRISQAGLIWTIDILPGRGEREPVKIRADRLGRDAPRLYVGWGERYPPMDFYDPIIGDDLLVVPTDRAGLPPLEGRRFPDITVLSSDLGLVMKPERDGVRVRSSPEGYTVSADGGLLLSEDSLAAAAQIATLTQTVLNEGRLFDLADWFEAEPGGFTKRRQEFEFALSMAADDTPARVRGHLNLIRLHLAHGFGQEALGHVRLARENLPAVGDSPEIRALAGAAKALTGYAQDSLQDLALPAFDDLAEAELWRGYANALLGRWDVAHRQFLRGDAVLESYPQPLKGTLAVQMGEAALRTGDWPVLEAQLARLDGPGITRGLDAARHYLEGLLLRHEGDPERAREALRRAVATGDQLYGVKAELAAIRFGVADGLVPSEKAIDRLEGLRFAWRGDGLEIAVSHALGQVQIKDGRYRDGFETMKRTVALGADEATADMIAAEMAATFAELFVTGTSDALPAVKAYALYRDYEELAPSGADGLVAVNRLVDRLTELDLLGEAEKLLEYHLTHRVEGPAAGAIGSRLAALYLLEANGRAALEALDRSAAAGIDPAVERQRRLLRARALSVTDRVDAALAQLAGLRGSDADRLRADILWRAERWPEAAEALDVLIGPPPADGEIDGDTAQLVLNRAVAFSLAGDRVGLAQLAAEFAPAMLQTPQASAFRLLSESIDRTRELSREGVLGSVAALDLFRRFLDDFSLGRAGGQDPA